jgi:lipopolysaccharide biosynthesis regulator YciM
MLVRLLTVVMIIVVCVFCILSFANQKDVDFNFFGETYETQLPTLMISSFALGALLVFLGILARDAKRAFDDYRRSHQKREEQLTQEELNRGMDDLLRGDLAKAKARFTEVLKKDPSQMDLYLRLAEISCKESEGEEALHWLERARLIDMKNTEILLREAEIYEHLKRRDDAVRVLGRTLAIDESSLRALKRLRQIHLEDRNWEEALRLQKSILKHTKGKKMEEEEALFHLGLKYEHARELLNRGGDSPLANALKEAKEIVRERKDFLPGFVLLGDIYLRMGKWVSAGNVWGKSFLRFKSIVFILRLEDLYLKREDPSTLLRIYQRALRNHPEDWVTTFFYAKLCLRLEMLDEALEALDELSLRQRDFPSLHRLLAEIYLHRKDFSRAAKEFEKTFDMSGISYLPFYCSSCDRESQEWVAFCPQCHRWNTYTTKEGERMVTLFPPAISERPRLVL